MEKESKIVVKSQDEDHEKKEKDQKEITPVNEKAHGEPELSEEDKALQEELDCYLQVLNEDKEELYYAALNQLRSRIKASAASVSSVPKPLKFLMPHYQTLKELYEKFEKDDVKQLCADIISVLSMVIESAAKARDCLHYKMLGSHVEIGYWGHEYVRHLTEEFFMEWNEGTLERSNIEYLIQEIMPYHMSHNAEIEACDFLMEIDKCDILEKYVTEETFERVAHYLINCEPFNPDDTDLIKYAQNLYEKYQRYPEALRMAIKRRDMSDLERIFWNCPDKSIRNQMSYIISRANLNIDINKRINEDHEEYADLSYILSNDHLNANFISLARELDIIEPKSPSDVYKAEDTFTSFTASGVTVDSAKQNLAASFVNGFVNAGFGKDKFFEEDGQKWIYKNNNEGMISAMASLGLIELWDVDGGLGKADKYLYSADVNVRAGALLACGIINCGLRNECDPALALLGDHVLSKELPMRKASILGLGIAYAGTCNSTVISLLLQAISDSESDIEATCFAAFSASIVALEPNESICSAILNVLYYLDAEDFQNPLYMFLPLAIGICYLGRNSEEDAMMEALEVLPDPFKSFAVLLVKVCCYTGTGNVLVVQSLLHICSEFYDTSTETKPSKTDNQVKDKNETKVMNTEKKKNNETNVGEQRNGDTSVGEHEKTDTTNAGQEKDKTNAAEEKNKVPKQHEKDQEFSMTMALQQSVAVLGIALIVMGEDIGVEMANRTFGHLFRYGSVVVKRAVPLAMGLISISNPKTNIIEILSKYSHDADQDIHRNAIFALGLTASGTNNARVANKLRNLALFHARNPDTLFMVRLAQGLVYLAKSTVTLSPFHSDRLLLRHVSLAGLLPILISLFATKSIILGSAHYILYYITCAIQPRMLATFNEDLASISVSVRVGQAVDVIGQAGKPKTITGFQTHMTPVLLGPNDRAELATDKYIALTPVLEGCVILRPKEY